MPRRAQLTWWAPPRRPPEPQGTSCPSALGRISRQCVFEKRRRWPAAQRIVETAVHADGFCDCGDPRARKLESPTAERHITRAPLRLQIELPKIATTNGVS